MWVFKAIALKNGKDRQHFKTESLYGPSIHDVWNKKEKQIYPLPPKKINKGKNLRPSTFWL